MEEDLIEQQYKQFLREKNLRELNLLGELPEDYEEHDYHTKPKKLCVENQEPTL